MRRKGGIFMDCKAEKEHQTFARLLETEMLAEKKANVYAKLLTEPHIAQTMGEIADRHTQRVETLAKIFGLKKDKKNGYGVADNGVEA